MAAVVRPVIIDPARDQGPWCSLPILDHGSCEPFKAVVHGVAAGLAALMGAYNAAAWLRRRQHHLAINAVIYIGAVVWECGHVVHHRATCEPVGGAAVPPVTPAIPELPKLPDGSRKAA